MWRPSHMLATLVLIVGMVFSPLRAAAAIPLLIVYDAASASTAQLGAITWGGRELRAAPKYAYDKALAAYEE